MAFLGRYDKRSFAVLLFLFCFISLLAWADDDDDPPARVGRMNYAQGQVSFQPGGEGDWVQAVPNRPLTTGDNLWADKDSRAELHVGSTALRIGSETSLTFLDLDDRTMQLRLAQGSLLLRVRHLDDDESIEVDTPNLAFEIQRNGEYRVDVNPEGQATIVDVFQGRGEAVGGGNKYTIIAGQEASFTGDEQQLGYDIARLPQPDDLDQWAFQRDDREDRADSANYVSRDMTGYEDLDQYGRWSYTANYGPVWVPASVPAGWAPYRFGHWVWIAPWGWTWVDDEPWGFAPFHYGRWCIVGGGWAWVPGPVVTRPVYAPALVAFVGGSGFNFSVSFGGGGGVAWFPLAPGEVFVPGYHVSRAYVNQVNVTNTVVNVTRITNVYNNYTVNNVTRVTYVNQTAPNAVTAVSRDTFVNARPIARNVVQLPPREIAQAPVTHVVAMQPVRESAIGSGRPSVAPPRAIQARQVVALRPPAPPTTPLEKRADPLIARPVAAPRAQSPASMPSRPETANRPVNRDAEAVPRPVAPPNRTADDAARASEQPVRSQPMAPRPEPGNAVERPGSGSPSNRPDMWQTNRPRPEGPSPQPGWSHPLVRQAPAVQPKSDQQAREEERKFQTWQQQQAPRRGPAQQSEPPKKNEPKNEPPKKPNQ